MDTSEEKTQKTMLRAAQGIINASLEISQSIRNLDNTIKAANRAARDIKIAGIAVSVAVGLLTLLQIILIFFD